MPSSTRQNTITRPSPTGLPRRNRLALVLAAASLCTASLGFAADDTASLQAEIAKLRQQLEEAQRQLAAQKAAAPGAAPAAAPAAAAPATAASPTAPAETQTADATQDLEAVVVRTRDRIEKLQDVPISVSVVAGKELQSLGATDISTILQRAGNVQWNFGNQRTSSLSIRGIGKQGQTEAQDPAVGLIVDGVSYAYNALSSSFDFTDIDTLEIARGPQGTLLGKNASIGAVIINTVRPSFTPSADYQVTFGQKNTVKEQAAIGGPIVDGLVAWRGNISASKGDGQLSNQYNPDLSYTNTDRLTGRVQFLVTPSSTFSALLEADVSPSSQEFTNNRTIYTVYPGNYTNGVPVNLTSTTLYKLGTRSWFTQLAGFNVNTNWLNGGPGGNTVDINAGQPLFTSSKGATATLNWNLNGGYTVTSITAYKGYHFNATNDEGTPFDINSNSGGFLNNYRQLSEELRLASPVGGFVDYTAGLYALNVHNTNDYRKAFGSDAGAFYANAAQYKTLDGNAAGRNLLLNSLDDLSLNFNSPAGYQDIRNASDAIFGQANWHLSEPLTLTTGLRLTLEDRQNLAYSNVVSNGYGGNLNPVAVNGVQLGGFGSNTAGALLASDTTSQLQLADQVAAEYFNATVTGTPGAAYKSLTAAQQAQVAAAKAIRAGQIGVLFNPSNAQPFHKALPSFVISPSYKLNDDQTAYFSIQHGEKAGVAQFTNGISNPVLPERTTAFELGLKNSLLDNRLIVDGDIYLMNVIDYQQTTSIVDQYSTALQNNGQLVYVSATSNVPEVQSKGVELDIKYAADEHTVLRFAGAYTDAKYLDFRNSPLPVEIQPGTAVYADLTGKQLPGSAKWTYNLGADYHHPIDLLGGQRQLHSSVNVAYSSPFNSDQALSEYAWVGSSYTTDFAIGLANNEKRSFDVNLLVKNLFNDRTPLARTWSSYTPNAERWLGIVFSGKI